MKYKLISCASLSVKMLVCFIMEAVNAKEFINPLWKAYALGIQDFKTDLALIDRIGNGERVLAFIVDKQLVGVCRITPQPKNMANGKVGYYIRPSMRKKLYAPVMLRMIEDYAASKNICGLTAVVDIENAASIRALKTAGWESSGKHFAWNGGRTAEEFRPKPCG